MNPRSRDWQRTVLCTAPASESTRAGGLSRRAFLKWAAVTASSLALPASAAAEMINALDDRRRLPLIWLSFQECTGCSESLTRGEAPTIERLLFGFISLWSRAGWRGDPW